MKQLYNALEKETSLLLNLNINNNISTEIQLPEEYIKILKSKKESKNYISIVEHIANGSLFLFNPSFKELAISNNGELKTGGSTNINNILNLQISNISSRGDFNIPGEYKYSTSSNISFDDSILKLKNDIVLKNSVVLNTPAEDIFSSNSTEEISEISDDKLLKLLKNESKETRFLYNKDVSTSIIGDYSSTPNTFNINFSFNNFVEDEFKQNQWNRDNMFGFNDKGNILQSDIRPDPMNAAYYCPDMHPNTHLAYMEYDEKNKKYNFIIKSSMFSESKEKRIPVLDQTEYPNPDRSIFRFDTTDIIEFEESDKKLDGIKFEYKDSNNIILITANEFIEKSNADVEAFEGA